MRKKALSKGSLRKKLQKRLEELWKQYCHKRDGPGCQVEKHFPCINIFHTDIMQIDHCFSRTDKNLFFDVRNGTKICSGCNLAKAFDNKSVSRAIDDIVKMREGEEAFQEMRTINQSMAPGEKWKNVVWLETEIKRLETLLS